MIKLTERLRNAADPIWRAILRHPFVLELYSGTLPLQKFKYYLIQDYNYLVTMYKCFSLIASKAEIPLAEKMLELAYAEATTEMRNYEALLNKLDMKLEEVVKVDPSPTNTAYMNFLLTTCAFGSPLEGLVSILPCFWSYAEIALEHQDKLKDNHVEIYVEWAKVYTTDEYLNLVEELKAFTDDMASEINYERLEKIFLMASRYEYMFWDMAYNLEKWPI